MRTLDLINLLRSRDRNSTRAKEQLSSLSPTRLRHLLGETSNWLRSEIQKYQDRSRPQTGIRGSNHGQETDQQGEIRAQIRKTLLAIIVIIDCDNHGLSSDGNEPGSEASSSKKQTSQELVLSKQAEEKILDSLLVPILIGIRPLNPQADSADVQLLCAKILNYCVSLQSTLSPGSLGPLFSPQKVVKRMMELTKKSRNQSRPLDKDRNSVPSSSSSSSTSSNADAIEGLMTLLRSPLIKLQDYGLRIVASHQRTLIGYEESWDLVSPLASIVQSLVTNLEGPLSNSPPIAATADHATGISGHLVETREQRISQELENEIGIQLKALILVQCYLQEAGKSIGGTSSKTTATSGATPVLVGGVKWRKLLTAVSIPSVFELWRAIQTIVLIDKTEFKSRDKIVLHATATVYWMCWVFQERAMKTLLEEAADTLLAWYGFFIVSRDQISTSLEPTDHPLTHPEDNIKHQSAVLEYLSQLIRNLVTNKKYKEFLFSGKRPIGIIVIRRTIEFLENILDKTIPLFVDDDDAEIDSSENNNINPIATEPSRDHLQEASFSIQMIQQKPGILEAMLGIMRGCLGVNKEADALALHTRLVNILVLALSDIQALFGTRLSSSAMDRRIHLLVLSLLVYILKRDVVPGLEDIPKDHWNFSYAALVHMIMTPLELEAEQVLSSSPSSSVLSNKTGAGDGSEKMSQEQETGVRALRVCILFWQHHIKGHNTFSELLGPRFYKLKILLVLMSPTDDGNAMDKGEASLSRPKWIQDRTLLLLETIVCFGAESSVRINMRERWSSLFFIWVLIAANTTRFVDRDKSFARAVVLKCLLGLRSFWFDKLSMSRLIEMDYLASDEDLKVLRRLPSILAGQTTESTFSLVPVLLKILAPPSIKWSSDLMLHQRHAAGGRISHPLFERNDPVLVEAALMLYQLSQFIDCQQYLISQPGVIWILGRMMVERTLVGTPADPKEEEKEKELRVEEKSIQEEHMIADDENTPTAAAAGSEATSIAVPPAKEEIMPRELLEKVLFDTLTRILSSVDLVKTLVSNNTITELFAAILDTDRPLFFYKSTLSLEVSRNTEVEGAEEDQTETDQILPVPRHWALHQQLLTHFRGVMSRSRSQFEAIFKYVGGHRSLQQDTDESAETMYWLREFGALVFLYLTGPSEWKSTMARVDKSTLLQSESVFGVVCRMLTLEVQYDPEDQEVEHLDLGLDFVDQDIMMREPVKEAKSAIATTTTTTTASTNASSNMEAVQKEEAMLRKFSAGLAIQSLCWRHVDSWRQQHFALRRSYDSVLTTEWEAHVATLKGSSSGLATTATTHSAPVEFLVQERVLVFPDRLLLSHASTYFQALLTSDFKETSQNQIHLGDLDADLFELLLEVIKESQMTGRFLLPEDLPFEMVLKLLVCADRFLVGFVKRLAEAWILDSLAGKELRHYLQGHNQDKGIISRSSSRSSSAEAKVEGYFPKGLKHDRESSSSASPDLKEKKRIKIAHNPTTSSFLSAATSPLSRTVDEINSIADTYTLEPREDSDGDGDDEPLPDCLLMIYETCSHPRFGNLYSPEHPFFGLLWDTLKRMALRLQTVAITARFATMLDHGGEDKIQELLQILYELVENRVPVKQ
ncbi:hypothetical protein BGZ83_000108 [Gryganskiella cystojenkinii]|nr:hypothetical protein BGZ83_000108 [Gryganskiella cystojenkinii]